MDLNFFAPYQGQKKEQHNKNIYVYSVAAFLSVAIVGSFAWNTGRIILLNNKIKDYNAKLEEQVVKEKLAIWEDISRKTDILSRYNEGLVDINNALDTRAVVSTELLNMISSCLPSQVTFNSISIDSKQISIQAVSSSRTAIGELENNLRKLENIQDVYIGGISGTENYTFDIKCVLKDVK